MQKVSVEVIITGTGPRSEALHKDGCLKKGVGTVIELMVRFLNVCFVSDVGRLIGEVRECSAVK